MTRDARRRRKAFRRCMAAVRRGDPVRVARAVRAVGRTLARAFAREEAADLAFAERHPDIAAKHPRVASAAAEGRADAVPLAGQALMDEVTYCADRWSLHRYARVREGMRLAAAAAAVPSRR